LGGVEAIPVTHLCNLPCCAWGRRTLPPKVPPHSRGRVLAFSRVFLYSNVMATEDPLDFLDVLALDAPEPEPVSNRTRMLAEQAGIPEEDRELFSALLDDPRLTDITQEIAYLRYLRVKLQQSIEVRREAMVVELGRKMLTSFDRYLWSASCPVPEGSKTPVREWMRDILARMLNEHFPILDLDKAHAAALRDMVVALGKMASEWKKVTEGMTIKIESNEDELFMRLIRDILIPSVPRNLWGNILVRAEAMSSEMMPSLPEGIIDYI
jgi:hypothetical protein